MHAGCALPNVQRVVEQQPVPARELKGPVPNTWKPEAFLITQLNVFAYSKFLQEKLTFRQIKSKESQLPDES